MQSVKKVAFLNQPGPSCLHKTDIKDARVKKAAAKTLVLFRHKGLASKTHFFIFLPK